WLNVSMGRVYSGASTLTMQLVRMTDPSGRPKTLRGKADQALWALRLERTLGKEAIMVEYLNRAPYGNRTHGVEAASRLYFGVSARDITPAQAAFLAALPRSPAGYNPYRRLERAVQRQRHILGLMLKHGYLDTVAYEAALKEEMVMQPRRYPFEAAHMVDLVLRNTHELWTGTPTTVQTTLDLTLQRRVHAAVRRYLDALEGSGVEQAAVVVMDNATSEVLALVGSRSWHDHDSRGQYNGATALRHPGMTLAPLFYTMAFEHGVTPATVYPDIPTGMPLYPGEHTWLANDDGQFRGPVRLREALARGLRVPTVRLLRDLDGGWLRERLAELDLEGFAPSWRSWGPSLMARDSRVSLLSLTNAYAALARGGRWRRPELVRSVRNLDGWAETWRPGPRDVFEAKHVALVTDILSDEALREQQHGVGSPLLLGYPVAALTTSEGSNGDFWTLGYSSQVTVGVWMGRFDGKPLASLTGSVDAAPLFRDVMELAMADREPELFAEPKGEAVSNCTLSGHRAGPSCPHTLEETFVPGDAPTHTCDWHMSIAVDRRNGLRAWSGCERNEVAWHTYVALPRAYRHWARRLGLKSLSSNFSPECEVTGEHPVATPLGLGAPLLIQEPLLSSPIVHRHDEQAVDGDQQRWRHVHTLHREPLVDLRDDLHTHRARSWLQP
ncbi:MAG: transglycosylase domain-containing protein, partial [Myxococcota bacterium]